MGYFLYEYTEYIDGVPYQGDSGDEAIWKRLVKTNQKAKLLQDLVDRFEQ